MHVVDNYGDRIHELVTEWYEGWMKGATSEADVEKRLEAMVEEVAITNTLCFGVAGWGARGDEGQVMNADFFLYVFPLSPLLLPRSMNLTLAYVL